VISAALGSFIVVLAVKSVWQYFAPSREILVLLNMFRRMVNDSIRIGLVNDVSSLRGFHSSPIISWPIMILQVITSSAR